MLVRPSLLDQTALISGAASGIGRATALRLASEGARMALADRDLAGAEAAAAEIRAAGGEAIAIELDVTSEKDWDRGIEAILARWGRLDLAVLAAGVSHAAPVVDETLEAWRRVMAVNLDGCFLGVRAAARAMKASATAERQGRIVLVSSASAKRSAPGAAAYAASKAAVSMLSRCAALELEPFHIRVNAVLPGGVRTAMWEAQPFFRNLVAQEGGLDAAWEAMETRSPGPGQKRFANPSEIAEGILYLLGDGSRFATGSELVLDGGYSA